MKKGTGIIFRLTRMSWVGPENRDTNVACTNGRLGKSLNRGGAGKHACPLYWPESA